MGTESAQLRKLWAVQAEVKTPAGPGVADTGNPTCPPESAQPNAMEKYLTEALDIIKSKGDPAKVAHAAVSLLGDV